MSLVRSLPILPLLGAINPFGIEGGTVSVPPTSLSQVSQEAMKIFQVSRRWLASLILGFASAALAASTNSAWVVRAWQSDEGLPGNTVMGVAQTPDGFLWVATGNGLARFDGVRFQEFLPAESAGGPGGVTTGLLADRRGRVWLGKTGMHGGGTVACVEAGQIQVFDSNDGLPNRTVWGMTERILSDLLRT